MIPIEDVVLRVILDSRGNPTVEAEVWTATAHGRAAAPSGASTGAHEAKVREPKTAVQDAEKNVVHELIGLDAEDQVGFDNHLRELDGTPDFSRMGANIAVALSLANAKAAAASLAVPLFRYIGGAFASTTPLPLGNVIGGGVHAKGATDIQEFLIVPTGAAEAQEAVLANAAVHRKVKELLHRKGCICGKGDEGAWAPSITDLEAFEILTEAVGMVSDELAVNMNIGIDVAASQLWNGEYYVYRECTRSPEDQISYIVDLVDRHSLVYVEDPLHEEDFEGLAELTSQIGNRALVCGDDIFVTQVERIIRGIETGSGNCVLIKPNQVGTLTDTFEAVRLAHTHGMDTVMSHRSGETTDETIAHLATAFGCIFLKTGVVGGERIAKLNELIRIEEELS